MESFGHYELRGMLGRGGMGQVFRAYDTATDRTVALKVLPPHMAEDDEFQQRFRREARIAASLNDPHVVPIHSYGEIDGQLYVDMRLIEGRDFEQYMVENGGRLRADRAVSVIEQVAAALDSARDVGLIHRDVKPSNILVTTARDFAYLIDFGIARTAADTALTRAGHTMGTVAYMAPERFRGSTDHRADVYSLACVLHECLTGQRPYPGESLEEQLNGHLNIPPPRPSITAPDVPPALDDVVAQGMAKDPDERYQTAIEFAEAARARWPARSYAGPTGPPTPPASMPTAAQPQRHAACPGRRRRAAGTARRPRSADHGQPHRIGGCRGHRRGFGPRAGRGGRAGHLPGDPQRGPGHSAKSSAPSTQGPSRQSLPKRPDRGRARTTDRCRAAGVCAASGPGRQLPIPADAGSTAPSPPTRRRPAEMSTIRR